MENITYGESDAGETEDLKKFKGDAGCVLRWLKEIELVRDSRAHREFEKTGERIVKRFKNSFSSHNDDDSPNAKVMVNILWANVNVLMPTLFCRVPKVAVERRFKDSDPAGRMASTVTERAVSFNMDVQRHRLLTAFSSAVQDRLLPGRGQIWLRYDAEFEDVTDEYGEPIIGENGFAVRTPKPNSERVVPDPLYWQDFLHSAARNEFEIRWKARRVYMTRAELIKRFGKELGSACELNVGPARNKSRMSDAEKEFLSQAEVWEIWDKDSKKVYWICEGLQTQPLDVKDDPLRLEGFFPCPATLLATTTTESTYPTPDFKIYERLADELDYVTKRLSSMVDCVRFVGATSKVFNDELKNMLDLPDGSLWPVKNWAAVTEKGGFAGIMDWLPFDKAAAAIPILAQHQQMLLQQIYEVVGIPDIVRGSSDPTETLGAQQMKGHWTSVRIQNSQAEVQRFCQQAVQIIGEIMFEPGLFSDETIALMCGYEQMLPEEQELFWPALELLRNDRLRTFRVSIETDSTIAIDEDQNQERWMKYMQTVQGLVGELQSVVSFRPELLHPMIESTLAAVRTMRTGRSVEGAWEKAMEQIERADEAKRNMPPPPPPPDPNMIRAQTDQQKVQLDAQHNQAKLDLEWQKTQMDFEIESKKVEAKFLEVGNKQYFDQVDLELKQFAEAFSQQLGAREADREDYRVALSEQEKLLEERRLEQELKVATADEVRKETERKGSNTGPVNIHLNTDKPIAVPGKPRRKVHKIMRTPEGLIGESVEIDDEPVQASA